MKTTLNIDATVTTQLKREAARQGRTMSELVETALRNLFRSQNRPAELAPFRPSTAVGPSSRSPTGTHFIGRWKGASLMVVVNADLAGS